MSALAATNLVPGDWRLGFNYGEPTAPSCSIELLVSSTRTPLSLKIWPGIVPMVPVHLRRPRGTGNANGHEWRCRFHPHAMICRRAERIGSSASRTQARIGSPIA